MRHIGLLTLEVLRTPLTRVFPRPEESDDPASLSHLQNSAVRSLVAPQTCMKPRALHV